MNRSLSCEVFIVRQRESGEAQLDVNNGRRLNTQIAKQKCQEVTLIQESKWRKNIKKLVKT